VKLILHGLVGVRQWKQTADYHYRKVMACGLALNGHGEMLVDRRTESHGEREGTDSSQLLKGKGGQREGVEYVHFV
jgi:hypothetical protein